MQNRKPSKVVIVTLFMIALSACAASISPDVTPTEQVTPLKTLTSIPVSTNIQSSSEEIQDFLPEIKILEMPLPDPLSKASAEISGLAWYGEKLVLLPQYPDRFPFEAAGSLFAIEKQEILDYLNAPDDNAIQVSQIPFDDGGLRTKLKGFEGYEAIVFFDNKIYLTIETKPSSKMLGYLVKGEIKDGRISIDWENLVELPPQNDFLNASYESMMIFDENIYTVYEDNGELQNSDPKVLVFSLDLEKIGEVHMPPINYRITDTTEVDQDGQFWAMNYFYPGDTFLSTVDDPLIDRYGQGETHALFDPVERIIKLQISNEGIKLVDQEPVYLELLVGNEARNWEGIVLLDDLGFIIATDKFPGTSLGFVRNLR